MEFDYLIVGQGICGTFLSWYLLMAGKKVLVIDVPKRFSSTRVASGIINPVTGRRVVTTWMIDELLPFAWNAYTAFGNDIGETIIVQKDTIAFPASAQMLQTYEKRAGEAGSYVRPLDDNEGRFHRYFDFAFETYAINPTYLIYLHPLLNGWRKELIATNSLLEEELDYSQLFVHQTSVRYRNVTAEKMIFCNGVDTFQNGYWQDLPYVFNKGQALIADVPGLPEENIYKYGAITLAPWYDNTWWIGSSYENDFTSTSPTERFYNDTITFLKNILKIPFSVKEHFASLRPAVIERRPFVGLHPSYPSIGILNGMGTKGCSLAPYCAFQLSQHLLNDRPIDPLADVRRFHRLLSR